MAHVQRLTVQQTNEKRRTCAYCRVSTAFDSQANSYEAQKAYYTNYIQSNPEWRFAGIYADEGLSATGTEKRASFLRMLGDCKRGRIDRIIVKSVSRFARNTLDCLQTVRMLKAMDIAVFFEMENIDTGSHQSEVLLTALGAVAQEEAAVKSQNMKWRIKSDYEKGQFTQSTMPYGYQILEGRAFVPHPAQADIVRQIFEDYLSGMGYLKIAGKLNRQGLPSPASTGTGTASSPCLWSPQTVKNILQNERYIGDRLLQKSFTEENTYGRKKNNGEKKQYYISGGHEPIVPSQDFYRAQALMKNKSVVRAKKKDHSLKGKIICGTCGENCWLRSVKKNSATDNYWYCGKCACCRQDNSGVYEKDLTAAFGNVIAKLKQKDTLILRRLYQTLMKIENNKDVENRAVEINNALLGLYQRQQALYRRCLAQELNVAAFVAELNALEAQINRLKRKRGNFTTLDRATEEKSRGSQTLALIKTLNSTAVSRHMEKALDAGLILQIVDKAVLLPRGEIQFFLKNGLAIIEETR